MAANGGRKQKVALLLAAGSSHAHAAKESGVGVRTIERWNAQPDFQDEVKRIRAELVATASAKLSGAMTFAANRLIGLLNSKDESVALRAARSILQLGPKVRETNEIEVRLTALEKVKKCRPYVA
jgi:hypothetical protein